MKYIFINLKRFDVSNESGGICTEDNSEKWIRNIIKKSLDYKIGSKEDVIVSYLLPESLLIPANDELSKGDASLNPNLSIGSQGVYRQDIAIGGNFGAFTTLLPAAAAKELNCKWSIIGHSEERRDKLGLIESYEGQLDSEKYKKAQKTINELISKEVECALARDINALVCIGETAQERGQGTFEEQQVRIKEVLKAQIMTCLKDNIEQIKDNQIVLGYEPIWAIGPGKTPPGQEYISFVSEYIKEVCMEEFKMTFPVVYGGGLKEANAEMIAGIDAVDGGLVALTKFTPPIGFHVDDLKKIIDLSI